MPTYNDYGIVLKSYNLSEADKILNIYTRENGLVRAVCKGAKKLTSKLGRKIDQLTASCFLFAKGKNLDTICEIQEVNSFQKLRKDLNKLSFGILFVEIVSNFAHEGESESSYVYDLLYSSLDSLQSSTDLELTTIKFILDFLHIHGFKPQLETCVSCSNKIFTGRDEDFPYSVTLGGLLCERCLYLEHKLVSPDVFKILAGMGLPRQAHTIHMALDILKEHINARAKNKVNTFDLVASLL